MRLSELLAWAEGVAPTQVAEAWDNVGLLVGDPAQTIQRVMFTVDYTAEVAQEARDAHCNLVFCYHPPIFKGLKSITAGSVIFDALRNGTALYSFHTALDVAHGGTNDMLASVLGLQHCAALRPLKDITDGRGMGRIGRMEATPKSVVIERIKHGLGLPHVLVAGPVDGHVTRAAVCAGSCGDCVEDAIKAGVELYLTGEMRHHDALHAAAKGLTVVCALHSNSERRVLQDLQLRLNGAFLTLPTMLSAKDRDPFQWA